MARVPFSTARFGLAALPGTDTLEGMTDPIPDAPHPPEPDPASAAPPPPAAEPAGDAEDEGVDRARLMESFDAFVSEPPAAAAPPVGGVAAASPPAPAPPATAAVAAPAPPVAPPRRAAGLFNDSAGVTPGPGLSTGAAPSLSGSDSALLAAAQGPLGRGLRQARKAWRFWRLSVQSAGHLDRALRDAQLLFTLAIGLVWLLLAYLMRHPVTYFFAALFLLLPALLLLRRGPR